MYEADQTEDHYGVEQTNPLFEEPQNAGPPGTGKTMAVHVISDMLELPLYRIDLSQIVDKYIGETEKRLEEVFDVAEKITPSSFLMKQIRFLKKEVRSMIPRIVMPIPRFPISCRGWRNMMVS